jgi:hypothetical protein
MQALLQVAGRAADMKIHVEHRGRCILVIDFDDLTEEEQTLILKIGKRQTLKALSAECNAEFVAYWAIGSVDGLYRRGKASR